MLKFKKIEVFFKKLPKILAERAFLTYLGLLVLALILGGFIFYRYSILAKKTESPIGEKPLHFEKELYNKVLEIWVKREERFEEADSKKYPDPFR